MRFYFLVLLSLMILSCQEEQKEIQNSAPKYPKHPITYEVAGDSITIYRHYPSRVKVDSNTLQQIPLNHYVLPPITINYTDSVCFDSVQAVIDSFNQKMVDNGVFVSLAPINLVAEDSLLFEVLFKRIIGPITEGRRRFTIHSQTVTFQNYPDSRPRYNPVVTYTEGRAFIQNTLYGYREPLTAHSVKELDSLHRAIDKTLEKSPIQRYSRRASDTLPPLYFLSTNEEPISVAQIASALSAINKEVRLQVLFQPNRKSSNVSISHGFIDVENKKTAFLGLYPKDSMDISISLDTFYTFTATYPYETSWPSFKRIDDTTFLDYSMTHGRSIQVCWMGFDKKLAPIKSGFVVAKYDIIPFLEEKLKLLGLNVEERTTFRERWAKEMVTNEYTLIHFATEEYEKAFPITINPEPDTKIRFMMSFKAVDSTFQIKEQVLKPVQRTGFTLVEWVGNNLSSDSE